MIITVGSIVAMSPEALLKYAWANPVLECVFQENYWHSLWENQYK